MPGLLYYSPHTPTTWTATSTKAGYVASSAGVSAISMPWASNATGAQQLTADLGSSKTIRGIGYQSAPVSLIDARADGSNPPTTSRGTVVPALDRHGVMRAIAAMNVSARYASAYFNSPTLRGAELGAYSVEPTKYEVGAMYVFGAVMSLPVEALIDSESEYQYAQQNERLANGSEIFIERGPPHATIRLDFKPGTAHDIEQVARAARAGICWLDLGVAARPELQWPVRFVEDSHGRTWSGGRDRVTLRFREVT